MNVVFYVSGHGFGHASRSIELIRALLTRRPDARVVVRTAAPRRLFTAMADAPAPSVDVQALEADTGIVQVDSLRLDEEETARQAARFHATFDRRVAGEADLLQRERADVVIGDIPPLAFAAAARAGVPSVAVGNFTWDWIYSVYPAFDRLAPDVIPSIRRAYATTTHALRLPLHGGFEPMATTRDIPFIARRSARDPADTRRALGLDADRPIVLPSFGAYGAELPLERLRRSDRFTLIEPVRDPPHGLLYQDLVAAADVVVTKPGFGIVSECIANGTALLYTSRGRFAEYDVFVEEMPRVLRCRYISQEDLLAGRWDDAIDALVQQPAPAERPRVDGADVAADAITNLVIG
jgi:UDP:flavonoid glycosyltransferase YjiC (YdhE family)